LFRRFISIPRTPIKNEASVIAYGVLLLEMSAVVVSVFLRRGRVIHIFGAAAFIFMGLSILGFLYTFTRSESYHGRSSVDVAVVLGASVWGRDTPSPLLRGRLNTALKLFRSGVAKKIVVTGGTKRFKTIESEVEASYLMRKGLNDSDIIRDRRSLSTSDQVDFIKTILIDSLKMRKVVIVTDRWHLPRVLLMCRLQGAKVKGMASDYKMFLPSELYYRARESAALQVYLFWSLAMVDTVLCIYNVEFGDLLTSQRRLARERVLQALYAYDISRTSPEFLSSDIFKDIGDPLALEFAKKLYRDTLENMGNLIQFFRGILNTGIFPG